MIPVCKRYRYKNDPNKTWRYSQISNSPVLENFEHLDVEFLYCGHEVQMLQADLANFSAEVACLKYENDQLKKEVDMLLRTLEYMTDECDALLSSSKKGDE